MTERGNSDTTMTQIEFYDKDTIKNILAVLTIKPDKVIYLYDNQIKDMYFFSSLKKCFLKHIPKLIFEKYPVDSNSIEDIYEKTKTIIRENENCVIELTGGSEFMLIGGYKAGCEMNTEMVYTNILEGKVINIDNRESFRKAARLTLSDFVDARGACFIGNSHDEPEEKEYEKILKMSRLLLEDNKAWKTTCGFLQTALANSESENLELRCKNSLYLHEGKKVEPSKRQLQAFQKNGFIRNLKFTAETMYFEFTSKTAKQYMINYGVWLELMVFISAKRSGVFDDVKLGAMIDWNAYDGVCIPGNEIDVILSDNSMPVFLSCKLREADTAAINELLIAKKRLGGWFSKGILITFGDDKKNKTGTYKRAQELGIGMLDKQDILSNNFEERLIKAVKGHDLSSLKWKTV